jgi:NADH:ubiquinone oxidoreductase subunit 3 (subunit A)
MSGEPTPVFYQILLFFLGGVLFVASALLVSRLLRPNRPNKQKLTSYESGETPQGNAWIQFNLRFYVLALVFILFEVEVVFLFPWSVVFANKELIAETNGMCWPIRAAPGPAPSPRTWACRSTRSGRGCARCPRTAQWLRERATRWAFRMDPTHPPMQPTGSPLGDALDALGHAAAATARRVPRPLTAWQLIGLISAGCLLAPVASTLSG